MTIPIFARLDSGAAPNDSTNLVLSIGLVDGPVQDGQATGHVLVAQHLTIGLHEFDDLLFGAGRKRKEKGCGE